MSTSSSDSFDWRYLVDGIGFCVDVVGTASNSLVFEQCCVWLLILSFLYDLYHSWHDNLKEVTGFELLRSLRLNWVVSRGFHIIVILRYFFHCYVFNCVIWIKFIDFFSVGSFIFIFLLQSACLFFVFTMPCFYSTFIAFVQSAQPSSCLTTCLEWNE